MNAVMRVDEQIKNQDLAKELGDMNSVLQWKAFNMMKVRTDQNENSRGT
jgi:hypothetical protein